MNQDHSAFSFYSQIFRSSQKDNKQNFAKPKRRVIKEKDNVTQNEKLFFQTAHVSNYKKKITKTIIL